ncbi:hypothetical protein [Paenibacillus amylolyticus]|uniref:hypothetical protein n=1 Tax=Paenibacillus amylolyticus TaxID=1451 RepID=UPI00249C8A06|nr:hypothetical protein [Paenibacillus amylolyticus]WFA84199.1 hypothetical protein OGI70_25150 [Paenibacillus amylolyticus]
MKNVLSLISLLLLTIIIASCSEKLPSSIASSETLTQNEEKKSAAEASYQSEQLKDNLYSSENNQSDEVRIYEDSNANSLIRSLNKQELVQIEWIPGNVDATLPIKFGKVKAELILGQDHPNGVRALVLFPSSSIAWPLDLSGSEDSGAFDDFGELQEGYKLQAAIYDFDQDDIPELIVAAGDSLLDESIWVFSFTNAADFTKINPLNQELSVTGQSFIELDNNEIIAPYGSQGLYDSYKYVDKQFLQPVR